jgi:hypothetical protein
VKAIALKKESIQAIFSRLQQMGVLQCDTCGEEFVIAHPPELANPKTAERQACWLEEVLIEEHALEKKHANRINLPDDAFLDWRDSGQEKKPA